MSKNKYLTKDLSIGILGLIDYKSPKDIYWEKKKVMAFAQSNTESYEYAKDSQYTCFLFDENVDLDAFIDSIK